MQGHRSAYPGSCGTFGRTVRPARARTLRSLRRASLVAAALLVACGAPPDAASESAGGSSPDVGDTLDTRGGTVETAVPRPPPSTTIPVTIDDRGCAGGPVEVAERILIERRQGSASPSCRHTDAPASGSGDLACWGPPCDDGRVFVDYDLDTTHPPTERVDPSTGAAEVVVPYAARHRSGDSLTIAAETIVLRRSEDGAWGLVTVEAVDLDAEIDAAQATAQRFLDALRLGDHRTAASLMVGEAGLPGSASGRDDLARLADDGLLTGTSVDEVAGALAAWCAGGAACATTPTVEVEITATHDLRIVATYELTAGTYATTLRVVEGLLEGLPIKVG
jgi:hypothetical protein